MFKFIFKTILLLIILIILTIILAIWKGGEPFRWIGEKAEATGKIMERFGDKIDTIRKDSKNAVKKIIDFKDNLVGIDNDKEEPRNNKNGDIDKGKRTK